MIGRPETHPGSWWVRARPVTASRRRKNEPRAHASTSRMKTLETHEISKSYRGRCVVNDVTVHVQQGEVVGLLGPNGAGKTTSFYIIVGLISPDSGRISVDGQDITHLRSEEHTS